MQEHGTPTEQLFARYTYLFDYFNEHLFSGALPPVFLNLSRKEHTYGFYVRNNWGRVSDLPGIAKSHRTISEISINPTFTGSRTPKEYISTLVHEMVHHWQCEFGEPGKWGYHNKQFYNKMISIGLEAYDVKTGGKTGRNVSHNIMPNGLYEQFFDQLPDEYKFPIECYEILGKPDDEELKAKRASGRRSKTKYVCSGCGDQILWGKPGVVVSCGLCGAVFNELTLEQEILHPDQLNPDLD